MFTFTNKMYVHFARIYRDISDLLVSHLERSVVINDINQENEKLTEYERNDILQFYKLKGCMEEILTYFDVVVNR